MPGNGYIVQALRDIQARLARVEEGVQHVRTEATTTTTEIAGVKTEFRRLNGTVGHHEDRIEALEREMADRIARRDAILTWGQLARWGGVLVAVVAAIELIRYLGGGL